MEMSAERIAGLQSAYESALKSNDQKLIDATKKALDDAKMNQTLRSERFKNMAEKTAGKIANVNQKAIDIVNQSMPEVYAIGFNGVEDLARNAGVSFGELKERTVKSMLEDDPTLLPHKKLDPAKDIPWNMKKMNSEVLQGIIQGESMDKVAKRLLPIVNNNEKAAIRSARTMVGTAQNNAHYQSLEDLNAELEAHNVPMRFYKQWLAVGDSRTRDSHADVNGETIPMDQKFGNGLMFPHEIGAPPSEVYNCRCGIRGVPHEIPQHMQTNVNLIGMLAIVGVAYAIYKIIEKQNYDEKPQTLTEEKVMQDAEENEFVAQHVYSADDKETLKEYQNELYYGKFHVTDRGDYGSGLYVVPSFNGKITDKVRFGIDANRHNNGKFSHVETLTAKGLRVATSTEIRRLREEMMEEYDDDPQVMKTLSLDDGCVAAMAGYDAMLVDVKDEIGKEDYPEMIIFNRGKLEIVDDPIK